MSSDKLIFAYSSDDDGAGVRSTDSSGILLKSAFPPRSGKERDSLLGDTASRGSSCSQRRNSRLSSRVSRKGSGTLKPIPTPFNFNAWVDQTSPAQSKVELAIQALVQAFHGETYMGTCLAAISVPCHSGNGRHPPSFGEPSLVVEDAKGALQCKLTLSSTELTQDPSRPQYVTVQESMGAGKDSNKERWTLMFQGQQEVAKFFASATTSLAAAKRQLLPNDQSSISSTLYESPKPTLAAGERTAQPGSEVAVGYTIWRVEASPSGLPCVGEAVEEVPKEAAVKGIAGDGRWLNGLGDSVVGMRQGSVKIVIFSGDAARGSGEKRALRKGFTNNTPGWTDSPTFLVAWLICVSISPTVTRMVPSAAEQQSDVVHSHRDPSGVSGNDIMQETCLSSPTEVQTTLAALQKQIASLQLSFNQLNGGTAQPSASPPPPAEGDSNTMNLLANATCMGLDQTVMTRGSKTSAGGRRSGNEVDPDTARLCVRSMKRLCNDIYREVELGLGGNDHLRTAEEKRVLEVVALCVQRCGQEHMERWRRRAERPSPPPSVPRDYGRPDWTPLRQSDQNQTFQGPKGMPRGRRRCFSSSSQMGLEDFDDDSCSTFRTPPPRAAMLLGSQDYRGSPTPPPLHLE